MSRSLDKLSVSGHLSHNKFSKGCPIVSHLLYADDCLVFANGSKVNLQKLMILLLEYASQSGQSINIEKKPFLFAP